MNLRRLLFHILLLTGIAVTFGCNKFLDILPSTQNINPTTVKDFQEMLNSDSLSKSQFFPLDLMSDDIRLTDAQYNIGDNFYRRTYLWEARTWDGGQIDFMYNYTYSRILQMNIILSRIDAAPDDSSNTVENRNNVISQALINRAWCYLQLVNAYGPAYDGATSDSDLGVPMVLRPDAYNLPSRATVAQIYNAIIADLLKALNNPYLKAKGADVIHPGKAGGYGLMARTLLYKQDYEGAKLYADSALSLVNTLFDLNAGFYTPGQVLDLARNPEVLLGRISTDVGFYAKYGTTFTISKSLLDSLGTADRRYSTRFYGEILNVNTTNQKQIVFDNSVSVSEMMLIKAECLARSGSFAEAGNLLTQLRLKRMASTAASNRTYTAGNILYYVIGERRRELCFRGGLRLFDMKRLNKDARFSKDILRKNSAGTVTLKTLSPGAAGYLVPFSPMVLAANPNIEQNPR